MTQKSKTLFDHIKQITSVQNPDYWETLTESERKTFSNYMVLRFMTMNPDWIETIAGLQRYIQELPPKHLYKFLIELLPKSRTFLKYQKPKNESRYETWLIQLFSLYYQVSKFEAIGYLEILYNTKEGHQHIKDVCEMYGTEQKLIRKLKLKVK